MGKRDYAWCAEYGQIDVVRERLLDELQMYYEAALEFGGLQDKKGLRRIRGNRNGVFTRDRQPKNVGALRSKLWKDK